MAGRAERLRLFVGRSCLLVIVVVTVTSLHATTTNFVYHLPSGHEDPATAATSGGEAVGADVGFVEWVRARLGVNRTYWLARGRTRAGSFDDWATFRLMPRKEAKGPEGADAVIWDDDRSVPRRLGRTWHIEDYAPGAGIAFRK